MRDEEKQALSEINYLWSEGGTKAQEAEAQAILEALDAAYPGHPWGVRVYDGGFFIRHLDFPSNWGMNCRNPTKLYSASALKRQVIMMAGEWLERARVARGRNVYGEEVNGRVDGIPENFQPGKPLDMDVVIDTALREMREAPRPQVIQEEKQNGPDNGLVKT